jgi:putative ABC transport system permease protein
LLVAAITPTNSFRETTLSNLRFLDLFTAVTPALEPAFDSTLNALLAANPAASLQIPAHVGWLRYSMLIGEAISPLIIVDSAAVGGVLQNAGAVLVEGRLPGRRRAEVVVHEDVARAKGLRIGDRTGPVVDRGAVDGDQFEVVGLIRAPGRVAVGTLGRGLSRMMLEARLPPYVMVYAAPGRKPESDAYLHAAQKEGEPAFDVVDRAHVEMRTEQALKNLPLLVSAITIATASAVALIVTLLSIIQFAGRADEFAMLLAIGHRRARLARRLAAEATLVGATAWAAGAGLGWLAMLCFDRWVLVPHGIVMRVVDPGPFVLSLAVPVIAVVASVLAMWHGLTTLDPLAVVDRRFA